MKAFSIEADTQNIEEIDISIQANTIYTFFNSILIDENSSLNNHIIYTDANALENKKTPYFLGEQLLIGDALITGLQEHDNKDISIPLNELKSLISYEVNQFYKDSLEFLSKTDINLYRTFLVQKNNEKIQLNAEWVLYTFNIADDRTKKYFLNELNQSLEENNTQKIIEKMAQLAMNVS